MRPAMERRIGSQRRKIVFYFLALISGVLYAFSVFSDVFIYKLLIPNPIAFALAEQWLALLFTVILLLIFSIPTNRARRRSLGTRLDRSFTHINFPSRKIFRDIIIASIFSGIATFSYYYVTGVNADVSAVIPFSRFSLIYLMIGDLILIRDWPSPIEALSIIAITFGVIIVGIVPGTFNLFLMLFIITVWAGSVAISVFFQSRAKRTEIRPGGTTDSLNLRLWLLLFLNLFMTLMMVPLITPDVIAILVLQFPIAVPWLLLPVGLTFFSLIAYLQALGRGKMSVVQSVGSISIVLGIPLTLLGAYIFPGTFNPPATDFLSWLLKLTGTIFVISGIIALSLSEMNGYVFIKLRPGTGDIMTRLRQIHGVSRVSAISGKWDYIIRIDIRSLSSTRVKTLRKIEDVEGVIDMETILILKEWN
ncbi:MAG: Lrp/AsnC ligand binding domain-containing protein [Candidatus Thorarchaeota archaeon]